MKLTTYSGFPVNLFLSSERKWRGPPKNATCPLIGFPQASPLIVWFTTAWNMEAAKSSLAAPSFIRGWISVFAKTPHLDAIGYIILWFLANSLSPPASVCKRLAIWSIKEPVPPAHIPFIRSSALPPSKYIIFASSPPSSIATSVAGITLSMAFAVATTSCINGIPTASERDTPPLPVIIAEIGLSPISSYASVTNFLTVSNISE